MPDLAWQQRLLDGEDARRTHDGPARTPGKRTLTMGLPARSESELAPVPVQMLAASYRPIDPAVQRRLMDAAIRPDLFAGDASVQAAAAHGTSGSAGRLPHLDTIQPLFGRHDVSGIAAHQDRAASEGAARMGAEAFATGDRIAFAGTPTLHTAAHEAAHVIQQRGGVQLKGGVGAAGDRYEQHADAVADRVVRGQSAESLLDELAGTPGSATPAVQRLVRLNGDNVMPHDHDALVADVRQWFEEAELDFTGELEGVLRGWLTDPANIVNAGSAAVLAHNLHHHGADAGAWEHGMTTAAIAPERLKSAKRRRQVERFSMLMEPHATQTPARVPGLGKLDDEELLRLAEDGAEEEEHWMRPSEKDKSKLLTAKRKGISAEDELHITASGEPDDPSYVVANKRHQLGHRYRGTKGKFVSGKHERTYGSKKDREGYQYKGSGLVDGHSVQIQDDQPILGPFQSDAPAWKTKVRKTDGGEEEYEDSSFLPVDESDERFIEKHPHNFYWENQEQGKHMRQKALETPAMEDETSFLHYNRHQGDSFNPNKGKAQSHIYDVPGRIEYLTKDKSGARTHYSVDNRPVADYSDPSSYDPVTRQYGDVPGGTPSHTKNRTLGDLGAHEHLDLAKMTDTSTFPFSKVLHPEADDFSFSPKWRDDVAGYESPPATQYFEEDGLDVQPVSEPGDQSLKKHFAHSGGVVTESVYDKSKDKTELSVSKVRKAQASSWKGDKAKFAELLAKKKELKRYQDYWDHVNNTMTELLVALPIAPDLVAQRAALVAEQTALALIDRNDPTQGPVVEGFYNRTVAWMRNDAVRDRLVRRAVGGGMAEPANDEAGPRGQRLPALRQFFNECGQHAAQNALALGGEADTEAALRGHGRLGQMIDEGTIREMIEEAGRPEIPVVGEIAQLGDLVRMINEGDEQGLEDAAIGDTEQLGLESIAAFMNGGLATLNMVLNTGGGVHWIAVQLTWNDAGDAVLINYRDSYEPQVDYTELFAELRAFLLGVPAHVPAIADGSGPSKKATGKAKSTDKAVISS